jgi:hypothetical protein
VRKKPGSGYEYHKENYTMSENFRRRMESTQEDVIVALNTGLQERKVFIELFSCFFPATKWF